jgi:hypothetical protein
VLEVLSTSGFAVGDSIVIDQGASNAEVSQISGFGSILLESPLHFAHQSGESVDLTTAPTPTPTPTRCLTLNQKIRLVIGILRHFGAHAGSHRYRARYDVNHDGIINIDDLRQVLLTPTCNRHHRHHDDD